MTDSYKNREQQNQSLFCPKKGRQKTFYSYYNLLEPLSNQSEYLEKPDDANSYDTYI